MIYFLTLSMRHLGNDIIFIERRLHLIQLDTLWKNDSQRHLWLPNSRGKQIYYNRNIMIYNCRVAALAMCRWNIRKEVPAQRFSSVFDFDLLLLLPHLWRPHDARLWGPEVQRVRTLSVTRFVLKARGRGIRKNGKTYRFISLTTSILNFSEYISENCLRVKAQPWRPEPKPTEPFEGSTRTSPIGPPSSL